MKLGIGIVTCETAFGTSAIAFSENGVIATTLPVDDIKLARENLTRQLIYADVRCWVAELDKTAPAEAMERYLIGYFSGVKELPAVDLDTRRLTEWQLEACKHMMTIPRGEVRSYAWLAAQLGKPAAARAAGVSCRRNPVPVYIPCHRVIGSDQSLTGFGGGLDMKRRMLEMESR